MAEKRFHSPELLAAWEYLDGLVQEHRRTAGQQDDAPFFIQRLRNARDGIETIDIEIDNNLGMPG